MYNIARNKYLGVLEMDEFEKQPERFKQKFNWVWHKLGSIQGSVDGTSILEIRDIMLDKLEKDASLNYFHLVMLNENNQLSDEMVFLFSDNPKRLFWIDPTYSNNPVLENSTPWENHPDFILTRTSTFEIIEASRNN